ncbi:amidohydrolase family protein [Reichenbachiella sp. MALMAid0571]|uniref:amidohydrolase family protein n=1 Tax=Reichenbachiella sp. MALMAid0571 TaxID=3143939 RepID=UPI0032DF8E04
MKSSLKFLSSVLCYVVLLSCNQSKDFDDSTKKSEKIDDKRKIQEVNREEIPVRSQTLAIVGATLIDGTGAEALDNSCIIVINNIINWVGKRADAKIPDGAEVFDATGMTLLPGLIDAHFHYDYVKYFPTKFVRNGITSVRDPGQWIETYDFERNTGDPLPRLFLTGPHLETFPSAYPNDAYIVRDKKEVRTAVKILADQGVSAIKVYYRLPLGLIEETCIQAHKYGLPVTAHLEITDARLAILAGLDGVEHITSLGTALVSMKKAEKFRHILMGDVDSKKHGKARYNLWNEIDVNGKRADSLVRFLKEKKTYITPTLAAMEYRFDGKNSDSTRLSGFQNMMSFVGKCDQGGVNIVLGSHGPWVPYAEKGWSYQHEMDLLTQAGMDEMDVIVAATSKNAEFLKISDRLGSLEKGKEADLILIGSNPLKDIKAMYDIRKVMLNGSWIPN